jgi:hypothetical protein
MGKEIPHDTICIEMLHNPSTGCAHVVQFSCLRFVNNLCIKLLLQHGNDPCMRHAGLLKKGFLPTMKAQLSQLPMIVGSGRVAIRRALFSCVRRFNSIT